MAERKEASNPTITCAENGPYLAAGLERLTGVEGAPIEAKETMALCRCGGSANKPFCDGAHAKNGFTSEKEPDRTPDKRDSYVGTNITISDNRGICAHAGVCTDTLSAVWRMDQEPWIDPDGATRETILAVIEKCPSGALSYAIEGEGVTLRDRNVRPGIHVSKDGPYHVRGGVALEGQAFSEGASAERYALCRCGESKNKPFCDGSHWRVGFRDPT